MDARQCFFEDVAEGETLPELRRRPDALTLFRFSAVTWNAHRIHYEPAYAASEGYAGLLVHSQLHGCYLAQAVTGWMGPRGRLLRFGWRNRAPAVSGTELIVRGTVKRLHAGANEGHVDIELEERDATGILCASATASVSLPLRAQPKQQYPRKDP